MVWPTEYSLAYEASVVWPTEYHLTYEASMVWPTEYYLAYEASLVLFTECRLEHEAIGSIAGLAYGVSPRTRNITGLAFGVTIAHEASLVWSLEYSLDDGLTPGFSGDGPTYEKNISLYFHI